MLVTNVSNPQILAYGQKSSIQTKENLLGQRFLFLGLF